MNLKTEFHSFFKKEMKKHFPSTSIKKHNLLRQSLLYTLNSPSSYFRPQLAMATTKSLGKPIQKIFPWATAIEMIHSGSLILDDLPCIDNARLRRGKLSNHLVFKEDLALISGSTLFIEAFSYLLYPSLKNKQKELLKLLVLKSGYKGMLGGEALDVRKSKRPSKKFLMEMFKLKTGALIEASVIGPSLLFSKKEKEKLALSQFAHFLGQAYQVADDLEDSKGAKKSHEELLRSLTEKSLLALRPLKQAKALEALARYNMQRVELKAKKV